MRRARGGGRCAARQGQSGGDDRGAQHDGGGDGQGMSRLHDVCVLEVVLACPVGEYPENLGFLSPFRSRCSH